MRKSSLKYGFIGNEPALLDVALRQA